MSRLSILGMMGRFYCLSRSKEFGKNKKIDVHVREWSISHAYNKNIQVGFNTY